MLFVRFYGNIRYHRSDKAGDKAVQHAEICAAENISVHRFRQGNIFAAENAENKHNGKKGYENAQRRQVHKEKPAVILCGYYLFVDMKGLLHAFSPLLNIILLYYLKSELYSTQRGFVINY